MLDDKMHSANRKEGNGNKIIKNHKDESWKKRRNTMKTNDIYKRNVANLINA